MNTDYDSVGNLYVRQQKLHLDWDADGPTKFIEKSIQGITGKILDIGCGSGEIMLRLKNRKYAVYGIDTSNYMTSLVPDSLRDKVTIASMEKSGFPDNIFDAVISRFAIHYLQDFSKLYPELHRILSPNGLIVLAVEHPLCDFVLNKRYERGIETKIDLFGIELKFPSHTIKDYFSKDLFKYFTIEDYDEGDERDFGSPVPEYIAFKARKNR